MAEKTIAFSPVSVKENSPQTGVPQSDSGELVALVEERVVASSLDIAARFGKRHKNVLQSIDNLLDDCPAEFGRLNFQPSSYLNEQNKEQPAYNLSRDGFALLAMGFTGKAALEWKILYISAFNAMEAALLEKERKDVHFRERFYVAAGALAAMLARETDYRRDLARKVMKETWFGMTGVFIAEMLKISVNRVYRIRRKYGAFKKDFYWALDLADNRLPDAEHITQRMRMFEREREIRQRHKEIMARYSAERAESRAFRRSESECPPGRRTERHPSGGRHD